MVVETATLRLTLEIREGGGRWDVGCGVQDFMVHSGGCEVVGGGGWWCVVHCGVQWLWVSRLSWLRWSWSAVMVCAGCVIVVVRSWGHGGGWCAIPYVCW